MFISRLVLRRFRNLKELEILPETDFNILWGENGQGKTNIIEAIYLLGTLKSFRGARNEEMVQSNESFSRLQAEIAGPTKHHLEMTIGRQGRKVRADGKDTRRPEDYFGILQPVLFSPEEIAVVKGSPAGRRSLVDRGIFQTDVRYLSLAREFDRHLRQRNKLLREQCRKSELDSWNEGFIRAGARLRCERYRYIQRLRPKVRETYCRITGDREEADLSYIAGGEDERALADALRDQLTKMSASERRLGQSLAGPQRDDVELTVNGQSLRQYGSQGQQRSFVLAVKAAQMADLEEITGQTPVLLLDDMTSELDSKRQNGFFSYLNERKGQVFITTTDCAPLKAQGIDRAGYFFIHQGELRENSQR